jgi:hypothetical protein
VSINSSTSVAKASMVSARGNALSWTNGDRDEASTCTTMPSRWAACAMSRAPTTCRSRRAGDQCVVTRCQCQHGRSQRAVEHADDPSLAWRVSRGHVDERDDVGQHRDRPRRSRRLRPADVSTAARQPRTCRAGAIWISVPPGTRNPRPGRAVTGRHRAHPIIE